VFRGSSQKGADNPAPRLATRKIVTCSTSAVLTCRSQTLWLLRYPDAALADADQALSNADEIGHPLIRTLLSLILCGNALQQNKLTTCRGVMPGHRRPSAHVVHVQKLRARYGV
jgi:hypothetical protein